MYLCESISEQINNGSTTQELESILGNPTVSADGEVTAAEALRFFFLLENTETVENGEYVDPIPNAWEEEFIIVAQVTEKSGGGGVGERTTKMQEKTGRIYLVAGMPMTAD